MINVPFSIGLETHGPIIENLSSAAPSASGTIEPDLTTSANLSVRGAAEVDLKFLGLAGGSISFGPTLTGKVMPFSNPCAELTFNASAEVAVELGRWGFEWTYTLTAITTPTLTISEVTDGCPVPERVWVGTIEQTLQWAVFGWDYQQSALYVLNEGDTIGHKHGQVTSHVFGPCGENPNWNAYQSGQFQDLEVTVDFGVGSNGDGGAWFAAWTDAFASMPLPTTYTPCVGDPVQSTEIHYPYATGFVLSASGSTAFFPLGVDESKAATIQAVDKHVSCSQNGETETVHVRAVLVPCDEDIDSDGDGHGDCDEFQDGTDPTG